MTFSFNSFNKKQNLNKHLQKRNDVNSDTLQGTNISPKNGIFEDDVPFPKVGYVNSLEGTLFCCGGWLGGGFPKTPRIRNAERSQGRMPPFGLGYCWMSRPWRFDSCLGNSKKVIGCMLGKKTNFGTYRLGYVIIDGKYGNVISNLINLWIGVFSCWKKKTNFGTL